MFHKFIVTACVDFSNFFACFALAALWALDGHVYFISADTVFTYVDYPLKRVMSEFSFDWLVVFSSDAIIATSASVQRQFREKPTSLLPLAAGGILASIQLLDGLLVNTLIQSGPGNCH